MPFVVPGSTKRWLFAVLGLLLTSSLAHAQAILEPRKSAFGLLTDTEVGPIEQLLDNAVFDPERGAYFSKLPDGREAELTLNYQLQKQLERVLAAGALPAGAIVMTDPKSGRILALAEYAQGGKARGVALRADYPAASVFKVITGAALLEAGVDPDREVCFHGGRHRVEEKNLDDDPRRDNRCATLSLAMGKSTNLVFSKLAVRVLNSETLKSMAGKFFFNQPLPLFPSPQSVGQALMSPAVIPELTERLAFGRTAAGFGAVKLSPLHGTLIAGTVANNGVAVTPRIVEAVWTGKKRNDLIPTRQERVISEQTAQKLTRMLERTVAEGTARKSFHQGRRLVTGDVQVAGKTGTLADKEPFKDYSWFVGFAPSTNPQVTVSAVAVNGAKWRVRAAKLAADALKAYFVGETTHSRRKGR